MSDLAVRLAELRARIEAACARAGRDPGEVGIVAVTKRFPVEVVLAAAAHGLVDVGENYAQELVAKADAIAAPLRWHFIGHLQRNKARQVVGRAHLLHAVDSAALLAEIDKRAAAAGCVQRVLLAVNVGGEAQKSGVAPEGLPALLEAADAAAHVRLDGLMTMPPWPETPEDSRPHFAALRALRDRLATPGRPLEALSMGTSGDLEIAVEEGATLVRVGTALFGPRPA